MIKCYHISNGAIASSDGEIETRPYYLDYLMTTADTINCFYHLNYSVANLLKMVGITKEQGQTLLDKKQLNFKDFTIKYIPGKFFSLSKGTGYQRPFVSFSDLSQYHGDELWRQNPTENLIGLTKRGAEIANAVYNTLTEIGLHPKTLASPIRAYQTEVLEKMSLPTIDHLPEQAAKYAYECCKGNWLEAHQIGHWDKVYDFDLNSAYPSETAALPDIRWGKWVRSNHYQNDAILSFCKASVGISADVSPIIYQRQDAKHERMNFNLQGEWEDCLTKQQIDFIREKNIGEVTILDGWWWIKDAANDYPIFYDMIMALFEHKSRYSGLPRDVVGRVLKGFYGKMLENIDGQMGALFNPVYGAQIECNTRLEVARFIYEHNLKPIHIAVDGVMAAQDVPESALSSKLGGWKKSYESSALVIGAGAVAVKGKQGTGDFSLDYDWLMNEIKTHPEKTEYSMTKPAPVTLVAALQGDNWGKLGDMHEITRSIEVDYDEKRLFAELPNNGGELLARTYQSEPLDIAMVEL